VAFEGGDSVVVELETGCRTVGGAETTEVEVDVVARIRLGFTGAESIANGLLAYTPRV